MSPIVTVPQETNSNSVLHIAEDAGDSGMSSTPRLEQVVKGVKATQAKEGKKVKARLSITPELLLKMKQTLSQDTGSRDAVLWEAVSLLLWFPMDRGNLCSIRKFI